MSGAVHTPLREALVEALGDELWSTYDCTRVWEAWSVGTMSQNDFSPVNDRMDEIVDALMPVAEQHYAEVLEALEDIITSCTVLTPPHMGGAIERARAAIAKAKGGASMTCPITADRDAWRGAVTQAAIDSAVRAYHAFAVKQSGGTEFYPYGIRLAVEAAFAAVPAVRDNEALAVLQTAHESELAMQVRIDALVQALERLRQHSAPIGPVGDAARAEALEAIAEARGEV